MTHSKTSVRLQAVLSVPAALALGGCRGVQSMLDPAGPAAGMIAGVWWLMAAGAAGVMGLVLAVLWRALARRRARIGEAQAIGLVVAGGIVLPTVLLIALLVHGTAVGHRVKTLDGRVERVIEVEGRRWFWTFRYLDRDGRVAARTTDRLVLPLGQLVEFRVTAADVIHSFWVPRLGGKIDAIPGRVNTLRLRAQVAEPMRGQCAEFCGLRHAHMDFDVVVLPAAGFERWLADGGDDAAAAPRAAVEGAAR